MRVVLFVPVLAVLLACGDDAPVAPVVPPSDEESATQLAINEGYDHTRNGAHLILAYIPETNAFVGTVENTTSSILRQVRVEVHLSNGVELGPTTPVDMQPGEVIDIMLEATSEPFTTWSAHPEVGTSSGSGGEGGSEGSEGGGETEGEHSNEGGDSD